MDPLCHWEAAVELLLWPVVEAMFAGLKPSAWVGTGDALRSAAPPAPAALLAHMLDELTDRYLLHLHFSAGHGAA